MICALILLSLALCGCGGSANASFNLSTVKPWNNYERMVYDYEKIAADGTVKASGTYTVTISTENGVTTIESSMTVTHTESKISDTIASVVRMDAKSMYPKYSEKKITDNVNGNGYTLVMNYAEKISSMKFDREESPRETFALPEPGQEVYDNEQLYQIVRAADNLNEKDNSGTFSLINGVDTYIYGAVKTYEMLYTVGDSETVKTTGLEGRYGINQDGNIPCRKVTIKLNTDRSGSSTSVYYSADGFSGGGKYVPVRISRSQFSTTSLSVEFDHIYTLKDYSAR